MIRICLFLLFVHFATENVESQAWDLAVAHDHQIDVIVADGTVLDTIESFSYIKALTFDSKRHQFFISDMNGKNDTIYATPSKTYEESDVTAVIRDIPDDIQGLANDPETDTLYWTDSIHNSINYIMLNGKLKESHTFIRFEKENPQDLVIHSCKREIFFTNSADPSSINKVNLDTKHHDVLIHSDLQTAVGITIDYVTERLYWSDWGPGIYFRIESANLEGGDRKIIISSTYQQPFGLAIDFEFLYWTDTNNNALWRYRTSEGGTEDSRLHKLMRFDGRPQGLVTKYLGFAGTPNCEEISKLIDEHIGATEHHRDEL